MKIVAALLVSLLLAACAGAPATDAAPVAASTGKLWYSIDNRVGLTEDELAVLTERLDADLASALVPADTASANHLRITVTSFRMMNESGRAVVGMVSGSDHIASTVQLIDPAATRLLSEKRILTRATQATGDSGDLMRQHGLEISRFALAGD